MSGELLITVAAVMVCCAFVKGATGLGFSTLALAILVFLLPLKLAIALVLVPSLASNLLLMWSAGNFVASVRQFYPLLLFAIPGMLLGLTALQQLDNVITSKLLALVLLVYAVWGFYQELWQERKAPGRRWSLAADRIPVLNPIVGFCSGVVNGATGSQIIPIMPYLLALPISKDMFVQTINLSFTINSLIMLIALQQMAVFNSDQLASLLLLIVPVAAGIWLGSRLRHRLSEPQFRQGVFALLLIMGGLILLR